MKNNLISIIIVNYNGKKWIKKCLDSVLSQTYTNFEIIFVDNASSDDSIKFVENRYKDKRIKIVKNDRNTGFAGGNNLGIDQAKGEYILLLNNDTWFEDDFFEKLVKYYEQNEFDVVGPFSTHYNGRLKVYYSSKIDLLGHPNTFENKKCKISDNFYLSGVCILFSKKLYYDTGGLDNDFFMYFEEIDWFWRLHLFGKKISRVKESWIHHAGAGSSGKGIKYNSFLWRNQNTLQMLFKNYAFYNLLWVLPIYLIQNIFEIIFFLLLFKPKIAYSYVEGWIFNIKHIKNILEKRKWIQDRRMVDDKEIIKKMYFGFGKLYHLINYFSKYDK